MFNHPMPVNRKRADSFASTLALDISNKSQISPSSSAIMITIASEKRVDPPSTSSSRFDLPKIKGLEDGSLDIPRYVQANSPYDHDIGIALTSSTPSTVAFSPISSTMTLSSSPSSSAPMYEALPSPL